MASRNTVLIGVAAVIIVAAGAGYFLLTSGSQSSEKAITLRLTEVREGEEAWVPNEINLKLGETVRFKVINEDDEFPHGFSAPELGVNTGDIPPRGGQTEVTIKADKVGTFLFNDPRSPPDCRAASPEEVASRDMALIFKGLVERFENAKSMDDVKNLVVELEGAVNKYKEVVPAEISELVGEFKQAASMDEVSELVDAFSEALEELEGTLTPSCILPGKIIVRE